MSTARTRSTAQAVMTAQRRANETGRAYLVVHAKRQRPLIEPLAGLEMLGPLLVAFLEAGRALLVSPQGEHRAMTAAEIVAESQAAR